VRPRKRPAVGAGGRREIRRQRIAGHVGIAVGIHLQRGVRRGKLVALSGDERRVREAVACRHELEKEPVHGAAAHPLERPRRRRHRVVGHAQDVGGAARIHGDADDPFGARAVEAAVIQQRAGGREFRDAGAFRIPGRLQPDARRVGVTGAIDPQPVYRPRLMDGRREDHDRVDRERVPTIVRPS
jgi:hypothetical protein